MLIEVLAWFFRHRAEVYHRKSRKLTRLGLFNDAYGKLGESTEMASLQFSIDEKTRCRAAEIDKELKKSGGYFASIEFKDVVRLLDDIQESAFFSKHLYEKAAQHIFWGLGLFIISIFVGCLIAFFVFDSNVAFPRVITLLFIFVIADELGFAFAWHEASGHVDKVVDRLNVILETKDYSSHEVNLAILNDYQVITAVAPPIPRYVYKSNHERLTKLWNEVKKDRNPLVKESVFNLGDDDMALNSLSPQDIEEMRKMWGVDVLLSILSFEERLSGIPTKEPLADVNPSDVINYCTPVHRLAGMKPEQCLAVISPEEIKEYLKSIEKE